MGGQAWPYSSRVAEALLEAPRIFLGRLLPPQVDLPAQNRLILTKKMQSLHQHRRHYVIGLDIPLPISLGVD
jgi:hypothetical protein